jgi:hypothetical protein
VDVSEETTQTAVAIGRFLIKKVIQPPKLESLAPYQVHGTSFATLRGKEVSNTIVMNVRARRTGAVFRDIVTARGNCLPAPVNIGQWYNRPEDPCRRCDRAEQPSPAHILNGCRANYQLMTKRHNQLAGVVRRAIVEWIVGDVTSEIRENTTIPEDDLSQEV